MRALMVINPFATSTSPRVIDLLIHAFGNALDLSVTMTKSRGHGFSLGEQALESQLDVVITLGGDGIVNEVVNGLLSDGPGPKVPMLAPIPGGSGNVFARALGLPNDPVEAAGKILEALLEQRSREIGLGRAIGSDTSRWFIASAGLGFDAVVINSMERQRVAGRSATPARYLGTAIREYVLQVDRKRPALTLTDDTGKSISEISLAIIQNVAPWTYFRSWPLDPCPDASFDTGLDVYALQGLQPDSVIRALGHMIWKSWPSALDARGDVRHNMPRLTITADRPTPMQVDGEFTGLVADMSFMAVPQALRAVC